MCSLLSGDSEGSAGSSSGLGVLSSDLDSPEMSKTSVGSNLLQSFEILSELGVESVGDELGPGSVLDVSLSVQEPFGDVVICKNETMLLSKKYFLKYNIYIVVSLTSGSSKNIIDFLKFSFGHLSGSIKICY